MGGLGRARAPARREARNTAMRRIAALLLALCAMPWLCAASDPGVRLELDLARFEVHARDLRDGASGPVAPVVIGSPAHPTPTGSFPIHRVVRNPRWTPGAIARARGAHRIDASSDGPLGVAKIAFGPDGVSLHGGARRLLLGKPVSLGCVRLLDGDMLALLDWLEAVGALGPRQPGEGGEVIQRFERRARISVR
jgi:hypothetical protein